MTSLARVLPSRRVVNARSPHTFGVMDALIDFRHPHTNLAVNYWTVIDLPAGSTKRTLAYTRHEAIQAAIRNNGRVEKVVTTTTTSIATYDVPVK